MVIRPAAKIPTKLAVGLGDQMLVDTRDAALHQSVRDELPVLVAIGTKPVAAVVMVFICEAYGDAVARVRPYFLDQAVIEFSRPFASEECLDRSAAVDELRPISPWLSSV